jgi:TonB family protein
MRMRCSSFSVAALCAIVVSFVTVPLAQINEVPPPSAPQTPAAAAKDTARAAADSLPPIDSMPVLLQFIKAGYPPELVKKGVEGQVVLDLVVDTLGDVDSVAVVKGCHPLLDSSAAAAAKKFHFRPALAGGAAVPVIMEYVYRFTLDEVVEKIEQYVNFKGRLRERGTRAPVRDAVVVVMFGDTTSDATLTVPFSSYLKKIGSFGSQRLEAGTIVTTTDSVGRFAFTSLPAGPISVKVISPGSEQLVEKEVIRASELTEVTYYLQRFSYAENEIVVYGKAEEKEVAKRTLTLNEVKKIPGFGGDAVKVVQALPGVARATFMSGAVVVRGAGNADSRFYLDGVQIPVLFHFGGLKSTYNSDALESVDFYPGGFGTRYGNVTAGVIEIKGRAAKSDRIHGTVDANFYDGSVLLEGPVTKDISLLLTGRRSFIGDILSQAIKLVDLPVSIQPYYWDYICRTDYNASKNQKFYLTLFGSQDYMKVIMSGMRGGSQDISDETGQLSMRTTFHMGIAGWTWTPTPFVKNELIYSLSYNNQYTSAFGFVKTEQTAWIHHLRNQTSITLAPNATLNAGLDAEVFPVDFELIMPSAADTVSRDTIKNWWFGDIGPYVNLDWKPLERLEIIPGIRYDYFPELNYRGSVVPAYWRYASINNSQGAPGEPSLRLTARYALTPAHTVKAAVGNYSQTPQPLGQTIMDKWGDPHLPATKASQYVAGYEWKITDLISADLQAYYNNQWDVPRQGSAEDFSAGSMPKGYYADGKGRMYGLELMLKHDQGKRFFGWIAYSLSRSERLDPHSDKWNLYYKDETHNVQFVGNYRLPRFWEIGCRLRYVTGDPTTPIVGITYNEDYGMFTAIRGERNSARFDPFFQLDLRIDKKFMFKNWILSAYLDFQNVSWFFYKSPEYYLYNFRYDPDTRTPVGGIPYPSLGLSAEF